MDALLPVAIVIGGLLVFFLFWNAIVWFISKLGGWGRLAEVYPPRTPFNERCWSLQSARVRWANYNGVLRICADDQGLHLSVIFPFRAGNPPLSVPWDEIGGFRHRFGVELRFNREPAVPIRISRRLADRLVQASGGQWQYES